ncbi:MAG TPA: hypothetical protein VGR19_10015 [Allosphingosinicella sp.]|nr:hypothetical protein [Allosphingosinicella sp.]
MSVPALLELEQLRARAPDPARVYIEAFATNGSRTYVSNLTTQLLALELDGVVVPVTVNHSEYGQAFTCLPHSAYALYSKAELDVVDTGAARPFLAGAANAAGAVLRAARINRVVNVNNWMMSTNLHARWSHASVPAVRECLVDHFPSHFMAVRSLTQWADADLIRQMHADGWRLIPSRQIFVMDDPHTEWSAHSNRRKDLRRMELLADEIGDLDVLAQGDAARISKLYQDLYIRKYTALNPAFTPSFVRMTHEAGVLRYRGARDKGGALSVLVATFDDGSVLTPPLIAYDQSRPRSEGLYRAAMAISVLMACERGMKLNWSAGAGTFKANRGGRPMIEYNAFYDRHLSKPRRLALAALDKAVRSLVAPFVQSRGF